MKKLTLILMVAFIVTMCTNGIISLHSIETPSMVVSNETANAGETVIIAVSLKNNPGIIAAKILVEYDKSKLTLNSVTDTGLLKDKQAVQDPGILYWEEALALSNNTENGVIAFLNFTVAEDCAPGKIDISLRYDENDVFDFNINNVNFDIVNGYINVVSCKEIKYSGAQIRTTLVPFKKPDGTLVPGDMRQGLRFCFDIPNVGGNIQKNGIVYTVVSQGALMILKSRMVSDKEMIVDNIGSYPGLVMQNNLVSWNIDDVTYKSAYVYNIPKSDKDTIIAARAYLECMDSENNVVYFYSEIQERSVGDIYRAIVDSGNEDLLDEDTARWFLE